MKEHRHHFDIPIYRGFEAPEQEAVDTLTRGVPKKGGSMTRDGWEMLIRAAFRGGVVASKTLAEERPKALLANLEALTNPDLHQLNKNAGRNDRLLHAVLCAYAKHVLDRDEIGWTELGEILHDVICNEYCANKGGDELIIDWAERVNAE